MPPRGVNDLQPERPHIEILKSPAPDVYMHPNGALIVTTGLLSTLSSEEELKAIITSEIVHLLFDHHLVNIVKDEARIRRAEFWSGVLAGAASIVEEVLVENNKYYIPGGVFITAELISSGISSQILKRLGMNYSRKQINEADDIALEYLRFANIDPSTLVTALAKIRNYYVTENDFSTLSERDYRDLEYRINRLKKETEIKNFTNRNYQKRISGITTFNAIAQLNSNNYAAAERLAQQNIKNKLASTDDYVVFIQASMKLSNSDQDNEKNLELIQHAKTLSLVPNFNLCKQEILLLLRMNKQAKASEALKEYIELLKNYQDNIKNGNEFDWAASEIHWANDLFQRIRLF